VSKNDLCSSEKWSVAKLRVWYAIFGIIYFGLILVAPIIIVSCKYELFVSSEKVGKLSGLGIIVAIIFGVIALTQLKKAINKLGEETPNQQMLKYTLLMLYTLIFPALALIFAYCIKDDVDLAVSTLKMCMYFLIGGIFFGTYFLSQLKMNLKL
jgi:hypothetical protein